MKTIIKITTGYINIDSDNMSDVRQFDYTIKEAITELKSLQLYTMNYDGFNRFESDPDIDGDRYFVDISSNIPDLAEKLAYKYK